jgi:hypothetical protein
MIREETKAVRVVVEMNIEGKSGKGRPKKRCLNMRAVGMCIGDVESRQELRLRTRVANPKLLEER